MVLLDETVVTLDAQGRTTTEGHRLIRILQDRALRQLSDQKIPFQGEPQSCEVLAALTHLPSGAVREPEASGLMEVSDPEAAAAPVLFQRAAEGRLLPGGPDRRRDGAEVPGVPRCPAPRPPRREPFMGERLFGGSEPVLGSSLTLKVPAGRPA